MGLSSIKLNIAKAAGKKLDDIAEKTIKSSTGHLGQAPYMGSAFGDTVEDAAQSVKNKFQSRLSKVTEKASRKSTNNEYINEKMQDFGSQAAKEEIIRLREEGIRKC